MRRKQPPRPRLRARQRDDQIPRLRRHRNARVHIIKPNRRRGNANLAQRMHDILANRFLLPGDTFNAQKPHEPRESLVTIEREHVGITPRRFSYLMYESEPEAFGRSRSSKPSQAE